MVRFPGNNTMKKTILFLLPLLFLSCSEDKQREQNTNASNTSQPKTFQDTHPVFKRWKSYYQLNQPANVEFLATDTSQIPVINGSVLPTYNKAFDSVYLPFLVYSPDKTRYIDFDSYQWFLEKGEPQFNVDQEIDLVDVKNKTVRRLAFRGPSAVVEEVYWKDNNTVVLLEIFDGKKLVVSEVNLKKKRIISYEINATVKATSNYFEERFNRLIKD